MRTDAIVRPSRVVAGPYVPPAQVFTWTGVGTFRGINNDQLTGMLRAACKVHEPSLFRCLEFRAAFTLRLPTCGGLMLCKRAPQRGARCHVYGGSIGLYHQRRLNPAERGGYGNIGHAF